MEMSLLLGLAITGRCMTEKHVVEKLLSVGELCIKVTATLSVSVLMLMPTTTTMLFFLRVASNTTKLVVQPSL